MKTILLTAILFILSAAPAMAEEPRQSFDDFVREFNQSVEDDRRVRRERRALELQAEGLREMRRQTRELEDLRWDREQWNRGRGK